VAAKSRVCKHATPLATCCCHAVRVVGVGCVEASRCGITIADIISCGPGEARLRQERGNDRAHRLGSLKFRRYNVEPLVDPREPAAWQYTGCLREGSRGTKTLPQTGTDIRITFSCSSTCDHCTCDTLGKPLLEIHFRVAGSHSENHVRLLQSLVKFALLNCIDECETSMPNGRLDWKVLIARMCCVRCISMRDGQFQTSC
jgi:hypothetical protein